MSDVQVLLSLRECECNQESTARAFLTNVSLSNVWVCVASRILLIKAASEPLTHDDSTNEDRKVKLIYTSAQHIAEATRTRRQPRLQLQK